MLHLFVVAIFEQVLADGRVGSTARTRHQVINDYEKRLASFLGSIAANTPGRQLQHCCRRRKRLASIRSPGSPQHFSVSPTARRPAGKMPFSTQPLCRSHANSKAFHALSFCHPMTRNRISGKPGVCTRTSPLSPSPVLQRVRLSDTANFR